MSESIVIVHFYHEGSTKPGICHVFCYVNLGDFIIFCGFRSPSRWLGNRVLDWCLALAVADRAAGPARLEFHIVRRPAEDNGMPRIWLIIFKAGSTHHSMVLLHWLGNFPADALEGLFIRYHRVRVVSTSCRQYAAISS